MAPNYRPTDYPTVDGFGEHGRDFDYMSQQCGQHVSSLGLHLPGPDSDSDADED